MVVAIGAGPVGLAAVMASRLYGPSKTIAIDLDESLKAYDVFGNATAEDALKVLIS